MNITNLKGSQFVRNVAILSSGTALAQVILLVSSPVLTRLYSPEDFGIMAVFMALVSSIVPGITGKYEMAMVLPKRNAIANELFGVAIWFGALMSSIIFMVVLLFQDIIVELLAVPGLSGWILLAPLVMLVTGVFVVGGYFGIRHKYYHLMARAKLVQAIVAVGINLILGALGVGFVGLLLGNITGLCLASLYLVYRQRFHLSGVTFKWNKRKSTVARRYSEYMTYNASTALLNGITLNLPVFIITHYYMGEVVGFYALVVRVMYAPLSFLSMAVSQVNVKKIVDLVNEGSRIEPHIYKTTYALLIISLIPVAILALFGPELFSLVFGAEWMESGRYAQILAFSLAIKFVASTLSTTLGATNNNKYIALWRILAFTFTLLVLGIFASNGVAVERLLIALVVNDIILYALYYYLVVVAAKNPKN